MKCEFTVRADCVDFFGDALKANVAAFQFGHDADQVGKAATQSVQVLPRAVWLYKWVLGKK